MSGFPIFGNSQLGEHFLHTWMTEKRTSSVPSKEHVVCILQLSNLWGTEVHHASQEGLMDSHRGKLLLQGKPRQCISVSLQGKNTSKHQVPRQRLLLQIIQNIRAGSPQENSDVRITVGEAHDVEQLIQPDKIRPVPRRPTP